MELRTDKIRACFDRKIGNFTELWNLSTNTNYVRCAPRDPLIELYGLKNGERVKLSGHISDVAEAPDALILSYDSFGEYDISAKVTCRCEQDRLVFSAEICNHSTIDVTEILMPALGRPSIWATDRKIISFTRTTQVTKQKIRYIITPRTV